MRRPIHAKLRLAVLQAHSYVCHYCSDFANDVDHIVPVKHNGSDDPENLIAACGPCNRSKRSKILPADKMEKALSAAASVAEQVRLTYTAIEIPRRPPSEDDLRKSVTHPSSMWKDIRNYQYKERIATEAEAYRRVVVAGLRAIESGRS